MPLISTESITANQQVPFTCAVTAVKPGDRGIRWKIEYGRGLDYLGELILDTDRRGNERDVHTEEIGLAFGWPAEALRPIVMAKVQEALIFRPDLTEPVTPYGW